MAGEEVPRLVCTPVPTGTTVDPLPKPLVPFPEDARHSRPTQTLLGEIELEALPLCGV